MKLLTILLMIAIGICGTGCNIIGAIAYKTSGNLDNPAQYELPARPTLILVENYRQPDLASDDSIMLSQIIYTNLVKTKTEKSPTYITPEKFLSYRTNQSGKFHKMTIPDVGRALGAEQVIYVDLQSGGLSAMGDESLIKGRASALVKVVDVSAGNILWPRDITDGRTVNFETSPSDTTEKLRVSDLRYNLYDGLGLRIARLFMKWKPDN